MAQPPPLGIRTNPNLYHYARPRALTAVMGGWELGTPVPSSRYSSLDPGYALSGGFPFTPLSVQQPSLAYSGEEDARNSAPVYGRPEESARLSPLVLSTNAVTVTTIDRIRYSVETAAPTRTAYVFYCNDLLRRLDNGKDAHVLTLKLILAATQRLPDRFASRVNQFLLLLDGQPMARPYVTNILEILGSRFESHAERIVPKLVIQLPTAYRLYRCSLMVTICSIGSKHTSLLVKHEAIFELYRQDPQLRALCEAALDIVVVDRRVVSAADVRLRMKKLHDEIRWLDGRTAKSKNSVAALKTVEDREASGDASEPRQAKVFISYHQANQAQAEILREELLHENIECWMGEGQVGGGAGSYAKIDAIRSAKVVLCCVTAQYASNPDCVREVDLSLHLHKHIVPLKLEETPWNETPWPPVKDVGKKMVELLYLRFCQRGPKPKPDPSPDPSPDPNPSPNPKPNLKPTDERTGDHRFWPEKMFQELVDVIRRQLSPPEPASASDASPRTVFLSYQWDHQKRVKKLYNQLTRSLHLTCWMDIFEMHGGDNTLEKMESGIRGACVVVACMSKKYAASGNCQKEVGWAGDWKKPIVPVIVDDKWPPTTWPPGEPMDSVLKQWLPISVGDDVQQHWRTDEPIVRELLALMSPHLPNISARLSLLLNPPAVAPMSP